MTKESTLENVLNKLTSLVRRYDNSNNGSFVVLFILSCVYEKIEILLNKEENTTMTYVGHVLPEYQNEMELPLEKPRVVLRKVPQNKSRFLDLAEVFNGCIEKYPFELLVKLLEPPINIVTLSNELDFRQLFEQAFQRLTNSVGREKGMAILPTEISKLMMELANLNDNASVFNPFAGFGSFGLHLNENQSYHGQEIDKITWALAQLRLNAFGKNDCYFELGNSLLLWPNDKKFDLVVASPPFRQRVGEHKGSLEYEYREIEQFLLNEGIELLKLHGKLICTVPDSFLTSSAKRDVETRKKLVEKNLLKSVISFPPGLLIHTNISFSILLLDLDKLEDEGVDFVEAVEYISQIDKNGFSFDTNKLLMDLRIVSSSNEKDVVRGSKVSHGSKRLKKISTSIIGQADWSLSGTYFDIEELPGTELNDLVEEALSYSQSQLQRKIIGKIPLPITLIGLVRGELKKSEMFQRPNVLIGNLKNDPFDFTLKVDNLPSKDKITNLRLVTEQCILVALNGNDLKPTLIAEDSSTFFINPSIFAFKLKREIHMDWLIYTLHSKEVKSQLNMLRRGSGIPFITKRDFLKIKVEVPTVEEQHAIVKEAKKVHLEIKKKEFEYHRELLGFEDRREKEMQALRHTLRQYLNALKSNTSGTRKFIQQNADTGINLDTLFSKNLNRSFGDHLMAAEGIIESMSKLLKPAQVTKVGEMKDHSLTVLAPEAMNRFKQPDIFKFEYDFDKDVLVSDHGFFNPMFRIKEEDFYLIISNIVENAVQHGFKEDKTNNIIRIFISYQADTKECVLEISNNGIPFPEDFDIERFKIRGEKTTDSSGEGIGGADIYDLLLKYKGKLELVNNPESPFPVKFIIKFPYKWERIEQFQKQVESNPKSKKK